MYLTGEAYLKWRKYGTSFCRDSRRIGSAGYGTTFGVRAYKDEKDIQTTLESGQVTVRVEGKSVKLVPNKQVLFNKSTMGLEVRDVDVGPTWHGRTDVWCMIIVRWKKS